MIESNESNKSNTCSESSKSNASNTNNISNTNIEASKWLFNSEIQEIELQGRHYTITSITSIIFEHIRPS